LVRRFLSAGRQAPSRSTRPLTRKEFYDLAARCREEALELARYDQNRVNLDQCRRFNQWLPQVRSYDLLAPRLATLQLARPVARWQVITLWLAAGFVLYAALAGRLSQTMGAMLLYSMLFSTILLFFVPERLYGTTIELLEGKVLRIVDALEQILVADELGLSEAAYFRVKENLEEARRELRQQIDLEHRRWR
jgi:hypothetical protein